MRDNAFQAAPRVVAEVSANHLGSLDRALALVEAAADAGAWGVKFQTYTPESMLARDYRIEQGPWAGRLMSDLYREAMTPREWHPVLFDFARAKGLTPFSSPFSAEDLGVLERLGCELYKVASFEILDLPLIRAIARTGKPMVISTGMATPAEIGMAVEVATSEGCWDLTLLKCTSGYPSPLSEVNLRSLRAMQTEFGLPVGLSMHTVSPGVAAAAVALDACMIEAHLTRRRSEGGPDAAFSYEPAEFRMLCKAVSQAHAALGQPILGPTESEQPQRSLRRSLYFAADLKAGETIQAAHLRTARPARGLAPYHLPVLIGKPAAHEVKAGDPVTESHLQPHSAPNLLTRKENAGQPIA